MNFFSRKKEEETSVPVMPFVVGDEVYHRAYGLVKITEVWEEKNKYKWKTLDGTWPHTDDDYAERLSFQPWEVVRPVHKRPFRAGWYVCQVGESSNYEVRYLSVVHPDHTLYVYLGKEMPKELK